MPERQVVRLARREPQADADQARAPGIETRRLDVEYDAALLTGTVDQLADRLGRTYERVVLLDLLLLFVRRGELADH